MNSRYEVIDLAQERDALAATEQLGGTNRDALAATEQLGGTNRDALAATEQLVTSILGDFPDPPAIAAFYRLMEGYGDSRGDQPVRDLMIGLHRHLRSLPDYESFVSDRLNELAAASVDFAASPHCQALLRQLRLRLDRALDGMSELRCLLADGIRFLADTGKNSQFHHQFAQVFLNLEQLDAYLAGGGHDWDEIRQVGQSIASFTMPRSSSKDAPEKTAFLDLFREAVSEAVHFLSGACGTDQFRKAFIFETRWMFSLTASQVEQEIAAMLPVIQLLFRSVLELDRLYTRQKRAAGLIDFSDFEHLALVILRHEDVRQYYQQKFHEVYIDEYQDTSSIQDAILSTVGQGNCLMVGDIKQSIYKFRHARPSIFRKKAAAYRDLSGGVLFELNRNFRSVAGILDAANDLFGQLMSAGAGEIDYDAHQVLVPYRETDPQVGIPVEVLILDRTESELDSPAARSADDDGSEVTVPDVETGRLSEAGRPEGDPAGETESLDDLNRHQQEARLALPRIRELVRDGLKYRDIVVLTRTRAVGLVWREVLEQEDLPVLSDSGSGFLDTPAMRLAESLIHVLDNQRQDIPLAAVMHAGISGESFSLDELAAIRLFGKRASREDLYFHQAVLDYRSDGPDEPLRLRVRAFLDWLDQLRFREQTMRLSELVDLALLDTGWLDRIAAGPDGLAEVRRLRQFRLWTEQFEKNRRQGLYRFARQLESLRRRGPLESPVSLAETDQDAIRIMTIHGSKGLEFPVVILAGTGFSVRGKDAQDHVLISENLGIGMDFADPEQQVRYPSLLKQAMLEEVRAAGMAEELRLLYVAMTRAMDRLILVGSVKPGSANGQNRLQKLLERARTCTSQRLPDYLVLSARTYLEWVFLALARKPEFADILDRLAVADGAPADLTRQIYPWMLTSRTLASIRAGFAQPPQTEQQPGDGQNPAPSDPLPEATLPQESAVGQADESPDRMSVEVWKSLIDSLDQRITQPYRMDRAARTPIKLSVSELKRREQRLTDPDIMESEPAANLVPAAMPYGIDLALRPMLHEDEMDPLAGQVRGSQLGILLHTVFRYLDFVAARRNPGLAEIDRQLVCMADLGMIQAEDLAVVRSYRRQILAFIESSVAAELVEAQISPDGRAFIEMPFTLTLPACQVYDPCDGLDSDDRVLVQGIIDCWYRLGDSITLIDYKSDRIMGDDDACAAELQRRYGRQLDYYAMAIETAAGLPVRRRVIWHIGRARLFQLS